MTDSMTQFWNAIGRYQRRYGYWATRSRFGEIAAARLTQKERER